MSVAEVLTKWAEACDKANAEQGLNLRWSLYAETLLCAKAYGYFHEELKYAHIAVSGKDLYQIVESVFPLLPAAWELCVQNFVSHIEPIRFMQGEEMILEIDVLCGASSEEHMEEYCTQLRQIRADARRKIKVLSCLEMCLGGYAERARNEVVRKSFAKILRFAGTPVEKPQYYCDNFTEKKGHNLNLAWFDGMDTVTCEGSTFPVFSGYREYLGETYGDYENGLHDEIGCGLTAEDKIALKEHQRRCKEALAFVEQLSQEFGLRYYLLAGSVLGPVRHGGFIPWDDDIDIGIRIRELARFEELVEEYLPQRLPEGFALKKPGANSTYPRMFSKICFEGRCCMDLWPLVPTYVEGFRAKVTWGIAKVFTKVHYKKIGYKVTRFKKLVKLVNPFLSDKLVMAICRFNERKYAGRNTPAYINLYSIYRRRKETILREWLDTETRMEFDGLEVPVVGCTHDYLTHLYGDYMDKPAPWKRASRHVERF